MVCLGVLQDVPIGGVEQFDVTSMYGLMTGGIEPLANRGRQIGVEEQPHAGRVIGTSRSSTIAAAYSRAASTSSRSR